MAGTWLAPFLSLKGLRHLQFVLNAPEERALHRLGTAVRAVPENLS